MTETAQARFDAADNHRNPGTVCLPDFITVYDHGTVGTPAALSSRRILIRLSSVPKDRIVIHHGIHISGIYEKSQPRTPKALKILYTAPESPLGTPGFPEAD